MCVLNGKCLTLKMKQNVLVCDFLAQKCLIMTTTCTLDMHYNMCIRSKETS